MEKRILRLGYLSELKIPPVIQRPGWFHWKLEGHWVIHGIIQHPYNITMHPSEATEKLVVGMGEGSLRVFKTPTDAIIFLGEALGQCSLIDWQVSLELCNWEEVLQLAEKQNARRIIIGREMINLSEENK